MSYAHPRRLRRLGGRSNATTLGRRGAEISSGDEHTEVTISPEPGAVAFWWVTGVTIFYMLFLMPALLVTLAPAPRDWLSSWHTGPQDVALVSRLLYAFAIYALTAAAPLFGVATLVWITGHRSRRPLWLAPITGAAIIILFACLLAALSKQGAPLDLAAFVLGFTDSGPLLAVLTGVVLGAAAIWLATRFPRSST